MKEKSAMENKIFDFANTRDALSQLSANLIELSSALKAKQAQLDADKTKSEQLKQAQELKIADLTNSLQGAISKIEQINQYIEEAL